MAKKKNRVLSLILSLAMVLAMLPAGAWAANGKSKECDVNIQVNDPDRDDLSDIVVKLQYLDKEKNWIDCNIAGTTDSEGKLTLIFNKENAQADNNGYRAVIVLPDGSLGNYTKFSWNPQDVVIDAGMISSGTFTVTWMNSDTQYKQDTNVALNTGVAGLVPATAPTKTGTSITYTFLGWSTDPNTAIADDLTDVKVTNDLTYYAVYSSTANTYTVTWVDGNGVIIYHEDYAEGVAPVYNTALYGVPGKEVDIPDEETPLAGILNVTDHFAYITGYPDNNVRPTANITRAEAATIFFRLMTDEYRDMNWTVINPFPDVKMENWFNNAVSTSVTAGIINGYPDGTFRPNGKITRAEFAAIAARFLSEEYDGVDLFTDIEGHWAAELINRAANAGWIHGSNGKFRPNDYITRAEAMQLVNNMLGRAPHKDHLLSWRFMRTWWDNEDTAKWYYAAVQEATNSHDYEREEDYEIWTERLPDRDWAALEKMWAENN